MEVGEWVDADLYNGRVVRFASTTLQLVDTSALSIKVSDELRIGGTLGEAR